MVALPDRTAFQGMRQQTVANAKNLDSVAIAPPVSTAPPPRPEVDPAVRAPTPIDLWRTANTSFNNRLNSDQNYSNLMQQNSQLSQSLFAKQKQFLLSRGISNPMELQPRNMAEFQNNPRQPIIEELRQFLNSQPELQQLQNTRQQLTTYITSTYAPDLQRIRELNNQAIQYYQEQRRQQEPQRGDKVYYIDAQSDLNRDTLASQLYRQQQRQQQQNSALAAANAQRQLRGPQGQTPTTVRNIYGYLPEGLTQEEFMKQFRGNMDQQYRTPEQMREYFKPLYNSYLKEKALEKAVAERVHPIVDPKVHPIVDPKRPTTTVPKTITPIEHPPVQPIVDPVREPFIPKPEVDPEETFRPPTQIKTPPPRPTDTDPNNPYKIPMTGPTDPKTPTTPIGDPIKIDTPTIIDPKRPIKPADTTGARHSGQGLGGRGGLPSVKPIKGSGPKMIVDPIRPTTSVPKHSGEGIGGQGGIPALPNIGPQMIVDPLKPSKPAEQPPGLMPKSPKKRKAGLAPSQYRGIDTNVRGLMRQ